MILLSPFGYPFAVCPNPLALHPFFLIEVCMLDLESFVTFHYLCLDLLHFPVKLIGWHEVVSIVESLDVVQLLFAHEVVDSSLLLLHREVVRHALVCYSCDLETALSFVWR